ncbi:MAG TPA: TonB family protein [Povalibacter sp.]|nr:TonB family protein [Povalibacter sp.]
MSATLNTFPAVHTFNSPRSWAMAIIVLIHAGFFWALTSGLSRPISFLQPTHTDGYVKEPDRPVDPPREQLPEPVHRITDQRIFVPTPDQVQVPTTEEDTRPLFTTTDEPPPVIADDFGVRQPAVEVEPEIDPRRGLSEPIYPAAVIREGFEGTVVLSVQVLENGRVGEVRIDSSSGDPRLDESAAREARRWRLIPGTRDGVPVVLWKQIPIRFRLQATRR